MLASRVLETLRAKDQQKIKALKKKLKRREKAMAEMNTVLLLQKLVSLQYPQLGRLTSAVYR